MIASSPIPVQRNLHQGAGGLVPGGLSTSHDDGGVRYVLEDTKKVLEEEGLEANIPEEVMELPGVYTFTGKNFQVINDILKFAAKTKIGYEMSLAHDVTNVRASSYIISKKSLWDDEVRTYTGTIAQIVSAVNASNGGMHENPGAIILDKDNSQVIIMKNGGTVKVAEGQKQIEEYIKEDIFMSKKNHPVLGTIPIERFIEGGDIHPSQTHVWLRGVKNWRKKIKNGERPFILVDKDESDTNRVVDGHHRLTAYFMEGIKDIPVIDRNGKVKSIPINKGSGKKKKKMSGKEMINMYMTDNPESPRWQKKKEAISKLSNNIQRLRSNVSKDIANMDNDEKTGLTALVIAIMDKTAERVGNKMSAKNGHFGVTWFTKKHVKVIGNKVLLDYKGKSGVDHEKDFSDKKIAKALKDAIKRSPGKFVFTTSDGFRIKADKVNRYLKKYNVSAKDLRGYFSNKNIVNKLHKEDAKMRPETEKQRKKIFNSILKKTAKMVGHGSGTLRKHYMIPELATEYIQHGYIIDLKEDL